MRDKQLVVYSSRYVAFLRWLGSLLFFSVSLLMIFKMYPDTWKLRYLVTGVTGLVFCVFLLLFFSYYLLVSKPFFVFDEQGVQTADGKVSVKYEDVDFFFFGWANMWYMMSAYTKEGETINFNTRNVVRAKVAKQYLREIGFVVKE